MNARLDVSGTKNDSTPIPERILREARKFGIAERRRERAELEEDAKDFVDALISGSYAPTFTLWELQGDMAIRLGPAMRRHVGCSQLDFDTELNLAEDFDWIRELPENERTTRFYRAKYRNPNIRFGRTFKYYRSPEWIKQHKKEFVEAFVLLRNKKGPDADIRGKTNDTSTNSARPTSSV